MSVSLVRGRAPSKTLVIGASGLLGSRIVEALGDDRCIRASCNSGERVDISDPASLAALFERVGDWGDCLRRRRRALQALGQLTDDDWIFSVANKLTGQLSVVRLGAKTVGSGGAITLTSGLAAQRQRDYQDRQRRSRSLRTRAPKANWRLRPSPWRCMPRKNASR